jgi:hypothetical protein
MCSLTSVKINVDRAFTSFRNGFPYSQINQVMLGSSDNIVEYTTFLGSRPLECINVDDGSAHFGSQDGVLTEH